MPLNVQLLLQIPPDGTPLQAPPVADSQLPPFAAVAGAVSHPFSVQLPVTFQLLVSVQVAV